jgi:hypothetical protein
MINSQIRKPIKTGHHIGQAISISGLRAEVKRANGVNAKVAVFLTNIVGSMWCAYVFAVIALIGLPPALRPGGEGIIAWIAQTFLQFGIAIRHHGRTERTELGERSPSAAHL